MKRPKSIRTYMVRHAPYNFGKKTFYSITTVEAGNRVEAEEVFRNISPDHKDVDIYGIKTRDALAWRM